MTTKQETTNRTSEATRKMYDLIANPPHKVVITRWLLGDRTFDYVDGPTRHMVITRACEHLDLACEVEAATHALSRELHYWIEDRSTHPDVGSDRVTPEDRKAAEAEIEASVPSDDDGYYDIDWDVIAEYAVDVALDFIHRDDPDLAAQIEGTYDDDDQS